MLFHTLHVLRFYIDYIYLVYIKFIKMLSSEKFILSVSTLAGSHEIILTKRIASTPKELILLKYMLFKD